MLHGEPATVLVRPVSRSTMITFLYQSHDITKPVTQEKHFGMVHDITIITEIQLIQLYLQADNKMMNWRLEETIGLEMPSYVPKV